MRPFSRASLCAIVCSLLCFSACDDGEPPPLDSGFDAGTDVREGGTVVIVEGGSRVDSPSTSHDAGHPVDATVADHHVADAVTSKEGAAEAAPSACGTTGTGCQGATICVSGACTLAGLAAGQVCGADKACADGTVCSAGYCTGCGGPGEPCCVTGTACDAGGCCVADICTPSGSVCPFTNGGLCQNESCGHACADGGCGVCGGAGQECCPSIGCTGSQVACETTSDSNKVCEACGGAGEACCGGTTCAGSSLACSGGMCAECGGQGEPCCTSADAGGACANGAACPTTARCP